MATRCSLVLIFSAVFGHLILVAQRDVAEPCQQIYMTAAPRSASSYAPRNPKYCDGAIFEANAGFGELSVIGVNATGIEGDPLVKPLSLGIMPPPGNDSERVIVRLQGTAKKRAVNYRLDGILQGAGLLQIGNESGMSKMTPRLKAEDVTWMAWAESREHGRTYYPVVLAGAIARYIEITVRPTIRSAYVLYSVTTTDGRAITSDETAAEGTDPGEPVTFAVPFGTPAAILIHVTAVGNGGRTQAVGIRLSRPTATKK